MSREGLACHRELASAASLWHQGVYVQFYKFLRLGKAGYAAQATGDDGRVDAVVRWGHRFWAWVPMSE